MHRSYACFVPFLSVLGAIVLSATQAAAQLVSLEEGAVFRDCEDCPEMVIIPSGDFMMGSSPEDIVRDRIAFELEAGWEQPKHKVTIKKPFAIGKYEITRDQFAAFVEDTGYTVVDDCKVYVRSGGTWTVVEGMTWADPGHEQSGRHPVVCVKWADANAYADWLAEKTGKPYRLVAEAEWEFAARAGVQTTSRFWDEPAEEACKYGNVSDLARKPEVFLTNDYEQTFIQCKDGYVYSAPVGSFEPNPWGVNDMFGNVWEWTADCFHDNYEGAPDDGSIWGTGDCEFHAFRGGSFSSLGYNNRATQRAKGQDPKAYADDPREYRADYLGFRIARDLK